MQEERAALAKRRKKQSEGKAETGRAHIWSHNYEDWKRMHGLKEAEK